MEHGVRKNTKSIFVYTEQKYKNCEVKLCGYTIFTKIEKWNRGNKSLHSDTFSHFVSLSRYLLLQFS
jgi:hypothetical protein